MRRGEHDPKKVGTGEGSRLGAKVYETRRDWGKKKKVYVRGRKKKKRLSGKAQQSALLKRTILDFD